MYFPVLRGKQNELIALRDLAPRIAMSDSVLPIIEPARLRSVGVSFDQYVQANMPFILILNPRVGEAVNNPTAIQESIVRRALDEYDNYLPALYVGSSTSSRQLDWIAATFDNMPLAMIYDGLPSARILDRLTQDSSIAYHIFIDGAVSRETVMRVPREKRVRILDCFRKVRNADYPDDEFFSDAHRSMPNGEYAGFGDYSIVGAEYSDDGGPAHAVTLHHVYYRQQAGGDLHIRHFVSDRTDSPVDPGGKYLEALAKLIAALPGLGEFNRTQVCAEYEDFHARDHYPALGYAKRMAIKHHLELMISLGESRRSS
jgi:hypothetical protein